MLEDKDEWLNENSGLPDDILISGGGDDIVGDNSSYTWRMEEAYWIYLGSKVFSVRSLAKKRGFGRETVVLVT